MSFPPPITGLKLRVSTGTDTYEQSIPSASLGNNSMQIMPNTVVFNAFNTNPVGTIFTPSIVTSYGSDELGNAVSMVSTPSVIANFIARKITPTLSLAAFTNKLTTDSPFSLLVTTNSGGVLSYQSSLVGVATVNSSGLVTIVGAGTTTITVNLAASANGQFAAASVTRQLVVSPPVGFSVLTDSDFASLDFDLGMTTLFTDVDEDVKPITMPNSNFIFNNAVYTTLYAGSSGWFSFGKSQSFDENYGLESQVPSEVFRYFGWDHISTGSYKFVSNNTRLLFKLTGKDLSNATQTFTIKVIIEQSGEIRTNYTLASTFTSNGIIIGYVGGNSSATNDDTFLTLNDDTFDGANWLDLFSLLNGKTILYKPPSYPPFGPFTLPTDIQVYRNQTITRVLTPPTSNSSGAFTFTSSNTAVATISVNGGVSSINVIGPGTTTITATQAAFGDYVSKSTYFLLTVTVLLPSFRLFTLPTDIQVYQNQTITRVLTPPTSDSSGAFTFSSSNTAVATISVNNGVSSINVFGGGTTTITATQALSGIYASSSVTASLTVTVVLPSFGPFILPSHELIYQSQTITKPLTPPTSYSSGAFTFTSTNTAVATISINSGVSSINVIGAGTTIITVTQAASGIYASSSSSVGLNTITGTIFGTIWRQLGADIDGEAANDNSGRSVSLSSDGTTLAIGASVNDGNGIDSGHVRVYTRDTNMPLGWRQLGGDIVGEAPGDFHGRSVSLSSNGNILAVGAYGNDGNGANSGHVRVYTRDTTVPLGWRQLGADINGEAAGDESGVSVSLSSDGTTLAIGASGNDGNGSDSGHVRVYTRDTTVALGWRQLGGDIDGEAAADKSGISVSLSSDGTTLAIGAVSNDGTTGNTSNNRGHVRVYKYNPDKTVAQTNQSLPGFGPAGWDRLGADIDGEATYDESGNSVSLSSDGTTLAIGAYYNDGNGNYSGHVRVYKYNPSKSVAQLNQSLPGFGPVGWDRLGADIDGEAAGDHSGVSVCLSSDGTTLAIGAVWNDGNGSNSGHVRVYIRDTAVALGWRQLGADIDGEAAFDWSGSSVSLSSDGTTLAIGAYLNDGNDNDSGHVRVYNINSSTFGPFTLPTDIQVYQNQTITRLLTPPTSDSSGAFTFSSSNTAVATISVNNGVSSINVIGGGTTTITAIQAASGYYASSVVTASLTVTVVLPTFGPFTLPSDIQVYQNQTITRVLTPPTSNSSGAFTFTSSNTSVATISLDINGVSSINVIGAGTTIITVTQAASGIYASSSIAFLLNTVTGTSFGTIWIQLGADIDGEAPSDFHGRSVSLSSDGTTLAIGATGNDANGSGNNLGHVRVYKRDTNVALGWRQLGDDIDGEAADDISGYSVSLSFDGTIVAIGATPNDGNGNDSGHVRVYKRDANKTTAVTDQSSSNFGPVGWTRLGDDIDGEAANDLSGYRVSLSSDGTTLAIGAPGNDANGSVSGHVRVYKYNPDKTDAQTNQSLPGFGPAGWDRLGADIDGEATYDESGISVSLSSDGTTLAIGASGNDGNGDNSGHVRVYKYNPSKSVAQLNQSLPGFGPAGWDRIGADIDGEASLDQSAFSVSLSSDGTTLAIGADGNDGNGGNSGHVRVYKRDTNVALGWRQLGADIDGEAAGDWSGYSVSLSSDGTTLAIGAFFNDGTTGNTSDNRGHVRVYKYNSSKTVAQLNQSLPGFGPAGWDRLGADIDGEAAGDWSGRAVSLSSDGNTLAIGASVNDGNGTDSGHVRVYNINSPTFGPFTLPSDIQVYQNQTITRVLTPPTSNISGAFTFTSSNTAVATISVNNGVSSINIIGRGTTTIIASQAASGGYASSSVTASLTVIPMLSLADLPVKLTIDSPFSLSDFVTKNSTGVLSYSSSAPSVATVNSSGLVTIVGAGTTTITVNLAASADGQFAAASVTQPLLVSLPVVQTVQAGFSLLTDNSDFSGLDFDSGMTTLFTDVDEAVTPITMPANSNFTFNSAAYTTLYAGSSGWFSFGKSQSPDYSFVGMFPQVPSEVFRYFGWDHISTGSYKFVSNNTRLLIKLTGTTYTNVNQTFTIKVIITQSGEIRTNYTLASTFTSNEVIIGYVGGNSSSTADDNFLTLNGVTFNGTGYHNLYSLLNGKSILFF